MNADERLTNAVLATAIISVPLVMFWGRDANQGHVYSLVVAAMALTAISLPNIWLRGLALFSVGWLVWVLLMGAAGVYSPELILTSIDGCLFILMAAIVYQAVYHSSISTNTVANIICIGAIIQALLAFTQYIWFDPVSTFLGQFMEISGEMSFRTPVGTLVNPNFLAAFLGISIPFFFRRGWRWFLPLLVYCLIVSKTSTAFVAALMGCAWYFGGWRLAVVMIIPGALYFTFYDNHNIFEADRLGFWMDAIEKSTSSWPTLLFGFGPGISWAADNQLHNEYVGVLFNFGVVGLALAGCYILTASRQNRMLFASLLTLFIDMIGNHPLRTVPTALLGITVMALIARGDG